MKSLIFYFILLFLTKLSICYTETEEKELFRVRTSRNEYIQFDMAENRNNYTYLFIQIILCQFLSSNNHITIINELDEEIYSTDIISSRNFYVDIYGQFNHSLIINATSSDMYVQYQYLEEKGNIILPHGSIKDYNFTDNSISFYGIPVIDNAYTTYDLYYLGKINLYSDICQKVRYILENEPIATVNYKSNNTLNITFNEINNEKGYYLIKGNNVNDISYYYFYDLVNVVNRLGPFKTNISEIFKIETKSDEYYSIFTTPGNPDNKKYLYIQIILCEYFGTQKSHFSIFDEYNTEIFFTDVITSRQTSIDIYTNNITIMATSPKMYIQYQFSDSNTYVYPLGIIRSHYSDLENHNLYFNITPVVEGSYSYYELFFEKNKSLFSSECQQLEYSLNNKPISTLNIFGNYYTDLNFNYNLVDEEEKNVSGYALIKSNNVNETIYTYFYYPVNTTINYREEEDHGDDEDNNPFSASFFIIYGVVIIMIFIIAFIFIKISLCDKRKNNEVLDSLI